MRRLLPLLLTAAAVAVPASAGAAAPRTTLNDVEDEVMCTVCGVPLNLATDAPQANRERAFIRQRIAAGDTKDEIKRRLDEASKFISLDQVCLSPQCGFASTEEGNTLAEAEQWAKLRMIVELAEEVWK